MLVIGTDDAARDEAYAPRITGESSTQTQTQTPGEGMQSMTPATAVVLPDYTVGGQFGSGIRNGFSTGIRSWARRFTGVVAALPPISNRVVGNVGATNRKNRLREGAKAQLTMYTQDPQAYLSSYVGTITPDVVVSND